MKHSRAIEIPEPKIARFFFADTRISWVWLILRIYIGWEWLSAGREKVMDSAWVGPNAGTALQGFINGALQKINGAHPDVSAWYGSFLSHAILPYASFFSHVVAYGEVAVGVALILGAFTGIAAFFGAFMNFNYLFAGTVSVNPLFLLIQLFLILAWRNAGYLGFDAFLLPKLGVPWKNRE